MLKTEGSVSKHMFVNDAKVIKSEIETTNGVIHIIDRVLVPTVVMQAVTTPASKNESVASTQAPEAVTPGRSTTPTPQTTTRNESTTTTTTNPQKTA